MPAARRSAKHPTAPAVLVASGDTTSFAAASGAAGVWFASFAAATGSDRQEATLGILPKVVRWTAMARQGDPYWMRPAFGTDLSGVPAETQLLLAELRDGSVVLIAPLLDQGMRFSLSWKDGALRAIGETNDPAVRPAGGLAAVVAVGRDVHALAATAAAAVARRLGTVRLRSEKPLPAFVGRFGWCTWDAFYHEVTPAGIRDGLSSLAAAGIHPGFLIIDDGWQDYGPTATGESRLRSLATSALRFPDGLAPITREAKERFGVGTVMVWHALHGYWGGVDCEAFARYGAVTRGRNNGTELLRRAPHVNQQWWGHYAGVIPPQGIAAFYEDLHRGLAEAGIDGVKVDVQAMIEGLSTGSGGRVAMTGAYRRALEASVQRHFAGRLINCMSHANDLIYQTADSVLMRSSDDFYPTKTEMHGEHLQVNAHFGLWFGQFVHPDWDMFHSKHEWGAYHAAGRAVSGSPLYVSDKPGHHDVDVLRTLVLPDGRVLRCDGPGVPTRDCLFRDVRREAVALKVANRSGPRGVVGVFNARLPGGGAARAEVRPGDVPGLAGKAFALRRHGTGAITVGSAVRLSLPEKGWEIVTIAPVERGVAAFGLADKLAGAAAIVRCGWKAAGTYEVELVDGGDLALHCARKVVSASCGGVPLTFRQRGASLQIAVPTGAPATVTLTIAKR